MRLSDEGKYAEMSAENLAKLYACAKTGLVNTDSGLGCYAMAAFRLRRLQLLLR